MENQPEGQREKWTTSKIEKGTDEEQTKESEKEREKYRANKRERERDMESQPEGHREKWTNSEMENKQKRERDGKLRQRKIQSLHKRERVRVKELLREKEPVK